MLGPGDTRFHSLSFDFPSLLVGFESGQDFSLGGTLQVSLFDQVHVGLHGRRHKAHRDPGLSRASGASDAVDEIRGGSGEVVVDDRGQSRDVDSPASDIRAQEHTDLSAFQVVQSAQPRVLVEFSVQLAALDPVPAQLACNVLGSVPCRHKDQDPVPLVAVVGLQEFAENLGPIRLFHAQGSQLDGRGRADLLVLGGGSNRVGTLQLLAERRADRGLVLGFSIGIGADEANR
mmetsp:Transcript_17995/g.49958  ORF Transcript_17995/g.49958 Transcript_17995/m.49958 type:complete len:232 (+) Transcript_17995:138-833(+)